MNSHYSHLEVGFIFLFIIELYFRSFEMKKLLLSTMFVTLFISVVMADYKGVPRTFLFNPGFIEIFDASKFKKKGPYTIGFSNAGLSNPWRVAFVHGIEKAAEKHRRQLKKFIITHANDNPTKQISDIQGLISQKVDILLVSPSTAEALTPILRRAMRKEIPVVLVDRNINSKEGYISFVAASNQALGRVQAQWLAEELAFKGNIVMLGGLAGASPAEDRIKAAKEVFDQYPGIKILELQYTSWSPANGKKIMNTLIQKYGNKIKGVWAEFWSARLWLDRGFYCQWL